jgi:predicted secreted hydrolase
MTRILKKKQNDHLIVNRICNRSRYFKKIKRTKNFNASYYFVLFFILVSGSVSHSDTSTSIKQIEF